MKNNKRKLIAFIFTVLMIITTTLVTVGATPATTAHSETLPSESVTIESIVVETTTSETVEPTEVSSTETQIIIPIEPTETKGATEDEATKDEVKTETEKDPPNYGFFIGIGAIVIGALIATAIVGYKLRNREEEEEE